MISRYLIAATFALSASALWGKETNPPAARAGDPSSPENCTECHDDGTLNNGDSNFTIIGLPSFYTPSRTYELNLLLDKNATGYGFQAIAKNVNNTAGSFTPVSSGITVDGEYIEHNTPSTTGQWTFKWTAPSTDVGLVTFYASGLVANSNGSNRGDSVYTLTADMNSSSSQNIPQVQDLVWSQPTRGAIYSSPTIGSDGTIYVGSGDDKLYAFYPDGGVKWTYQAGEWVDSTPSIADDGTVYVGSWDNKVHAINPDGTGKWTFSTDSLVLAGPAVGPDGTIYFGSHDNFFYALESNGSMKWEYFAEQPISSSAALGQDGTIYFGDDNGTFHAVNPDGTSKWTYVVDTISESNSSIESSPALDLYGYIYFGSANGYCYSLEDNGTNGVLRWKYATADRVDSSPVIGLSNEVFFMSRDGYLRSIDIDFGVTNWEKPIGDVFYSSPVVDKNGTVYVVGYLGGGENHIFAIDSNGSMDWNSSMTNHSVVIGDVVDSSLTIDSNGTLYFGSFDKKLYAVKAGWNLADSDWPKFRRDNLGTGRWPSYQIDANASPTEGGIITGAGVYNEGANATIFANPSVGYTFDHWSGDGVFDPNDANTTVPMTQARSVTAHFERIQYTLNISAGAGGSVTSSGVYDHGTDANITATPQTGYFFASWTGDGIADVNASTTTVEMTQDRNVTANFAIKEYILAVSAGSGGDTIGEGNYTHGTIASITANPDTGYHFINWTGAVTDFTSASSTVTMDQNRTVSANFAINEYILAVSAGSGGDAIGEGNYTHGTDASITATSQTGYSFTSWSGAGIADLNASTTTVDMTQDRNVTANFAIDRHVLIVSKEIGGTATGSETFDWNSSVPIVATVNTGYEFTGWTGAGVNDADALSTTIAMTQDRNVTATFLIKSYFLTTNTSDGGSVSGSSTHNHRTQATITATPQTGYSFAGWTGEGIADPNASTTTVDVTEDRNATANFVADIHTLIFSANSSGTTSGDGNFSYGTNAPITASPDEGYYFTNWSGLGIADTNSPSTTVSMTQDRNVTANFALVPINQRILQTYADPVGSGSTGGSGAYNENTVVNVSANAAAGHHFLGWTATGGTLSLPLSLTSATVTLNQDSDANANAHFASLGYKLDLVSSTGGSATGDGNYSYGQTVSIKATPDNGYRFAGWEVNGTLDFAVSVAARQYDASANAFLLNSKESPPLTLVRGNVYQFVLDGTTTANHPFYFSEDAGGGGNPSLGKYTSGITGSESTSGTVVITVDAETPNTLYYYCGDHSGMGNVINVIDSTGLAADVNASTTSADTNASYVLQANFSLEQHLLTVNAGTGGSVSGGGTFDYGTNANITATPDPSYVFSNWSGFGFADENSSATTVLIISDQSVTGNFELGFYALTVVVSANGGGSVIGGGNYGYGQSVNIAATPSTGYSFVGWTGASPVEANASNTSITVTSSQTITANFAPSTHNLLLLSSPTIGGTLIGSGPYAYGSEANVTATPSPGYIFSNWSGIGIIDANSSVTSILITSDQSVTANFELAPYALNLTSDPPAGGSTIGGGGYNLSEVVQIRATPSTGYAFAGWEGGNPADANASTTTVTIADSASLTAKFEKLQYNVNIAVSPVGTATVSGGGSYQHGDIVSLASTPIKGYEFSHWSGANLADTNSSSQSFTVSRDLALVANFERHADAGTLSYALDATELEAGWQESSWFGYFHQTTPEWAYHFDFGWIYTKPENDYSIWFWTQRFGWQWTNKDAYPNAWSQDNYEWNYFSRIPDGTFAYYDYSISSWEKIATTYEITVVSYPSNAGSIIGGGVYEEGTTTDIQATAAEGYVFKRWFGDATGTSANIHVTTSGNLIIYAYFEASNP